VSARLRDVRLFLLLALLGLAGLLALGLSGAFAAGERTVTLTAQVLPGEGYPNGRYVYLPFDVPAGVNRVSVRVTKNDASGQARIGAGLFDQRGPGYQSGGFRGIYGEERGEFFVAADSASQSFTPGRIEPGRWTVIVPIFRTGPEPFTVTANVTLSFGDQPAEAPLGAQQGVVDRDADWYRGDLHVHTNESSDAFASERAFEAREYGDRAREVGLDWLSLTDHNVTTQNRHLARDHDRSGTLVLGGEEMTNWFHGHATVSGLAPGDHIDWRQRPLEVPLRENEVRIQRFIEEVRRRDVYTAAAHPYGATLAWQFFGDAARDPAGALPDGLEVWTGPFQPDDQVSVEQWDELLREGRRIFANGGSDVHGFDRGDGFALAQPTTVVYAPELSRTAIVRALRQGRSFVTRRPEGAELYLSATGPSGQRQPVGGTLYGEAGDRIAFSILARQAAGMRLDVIRDGSVVQSTPITSAAQTVRFEQPVGAGGFVRAELRGAPAIAPAGGFQSSRMDMEALTNPIFLLRGPIPPGTEPVDAPPPARVGPRRPPTRPQPDGGEDNHGSPASSPASRACRFRGALRGATVRPRARGLRIGVAARSGARPVVDVFRVSAGRDVLGQRRVARFRRAGAFTWAGRSRGRRARLGDGHYVVRVRVPGARGVGDSRRIALLRRGGRFRLRPDFERTDPCGALRLLKLERPVAGGRRNVPLRLAYRVGAGGGRVTVEVLRGRRVVRRVPELFRRAGLVHRVRLGTERLPRGDLRVRVTLRQGEPVTVREVVVRRL